MRLVGYGKTMLGDIKIYSSDKFWNQIFTDLGISVAENADVADVIFDDIDIKMPISVIDLKNAVFTYLDNSDVVRSVFGANILLPVLQHKIIITLSKKPDITMAELKLLIGLSPDITTHTVENAIYQLRKKYGHDIILNINGKYRIGQL